MTPKEILRAMYEGLVIERYSGRKAHAQFCGLRGTRLKYCDCPWLEPPAPWVEPLVGLLEREEEEEAKDTEQ
ncbi:MAG: hypothetical protein KC492_44490 [Myxococcales bacterium]|nr:hypothetical protein [Myxococcales bacterium]